MDWPHHHIAPQVAAMIPSLFEALSDEANDAQDFDPFGLKNALLLEQNRSNAMRSSSEGLGATLAVQSGERGTKTNSATITKGKLSGMTLASALARRRDICDGMHTSQADSCSYILNYQSALAKDQAKSHEGRYKDNWKRTVTLNGHVRRQKEAFDSRASAGMNNEGTRPLPNDAKSSREPSPDTKDLPTKSASLQPGGISSQSLSSSSDSASSWSGTDFGESDSILFSPGIAETTIYEYYQEERRQGERATSAERDEYSQVYDDVGQPTLTNAEFCSAVSTGEHHDNNANSHRRTTDVPCQITLVAQDEDGSCTPRAQQSFDSLRCGTDEEAKSTPSKSNDTKEPETNERKNDRDVATLVRRRIESVRRSIALKELDLHKYPDFKENTESSPEFLLMRSKLRKVYDRVEEPKLQGASAMRLSADKKNGKTKRQELYSPDAPSFDGLPNEGTEVTAPESFELGSKQSFDPSETSNSVLDDAQTLIPSLHATDPPETKFAKISDLFVDKSASTPPRKAGLGLESARQHELDDTTAESSAESDSQVLRENMHPTIESKDPKYAKYFKMLKVGMPMPAVQHAMTRDGLDPNVMDGEHNNRPVAVDGGVPLKEDPKYTKYFKMLAMGLPIEAVKHSMQRDGMDPNVLDADHSAPAPTRQKPSEAQKGPKDTHRRTRLHWGILDEVQIRSNSVWARLDEDPDVAQVSTGGIDELEFAELFQAELSGETKRRSQPIGAVSDSKCSAVKVIDHQRANNGGIILARVRAISFEEIAKDINEMNDVLTPEQLHSIIPFLPTLEEKELLRMYLGNQTFGGLCECEKFMVAMLDVCRPEEKMQALVFKSHYTSLVEELRNDTLVVEKACDELNRSTRLRKLLGIVLTIGNRLNTAGQRRDKAAAGVTLDSLLKLNQVKAFDKKTTFLQYLVSVVHRNNEHLLCFKEDLVAVQKAEKIIWNQCIEQLELLEAQIRNTRSIALHQARVLHGDNAIDDEETCSKESTTNTEAITKEEEDKLRSTGVGAFVLDAFREVSVLRDKIEEIQQTFELLKDYFGEINTEMQPHGLFRIIATFSRDVDAARTALETKKGKRKLPWRRKKQAN